MGAFGRGGMLIGPTLPPPPPGPPPFNPMSISGGVLWLRADLGVTLSSGSVLQWNDQSGVGDSNRNFANTAPYLPVYNSSDGSYNGQSTLSFTWSPGTQQLISGVWSPSVNTPVTLFIVGNDDGSTNEQIYFLEHDASIYYLWTISGVYATDGGSNLESSIPISTTPKVFCIVVCATGSSTGSMAVDAITPNVTGNNSVSSMRQQFIGDNFNGKIAEIIAYSGALSQTNITTVMDYLGTRYGISITAPFTPASLSGLTVWLRADLGFSAGTWTDQSAHGFSFTQSTGPEQPTFNSSSFNGQPGITFTKASSQSMSTAANAAFDLSAFTIYVIFKQTSSAAYDVLLSNSSSYGWADGWGITNPIGSSGNMGGWSGSYTDASYGSISTATPYVIRTEYSAGTTNTWINGSPQTSGTGTETDSSAALCLGAQSSVAGYYDGDICEIVIVNRILNSTELSEMATYILNRYGLTA